MAVSSATLPSFKPQSFYLNAKNDIWFLYQHALQLLTENTPNGKKVQILLEELHDIYGTSWATRLIDLETDEQKKSWFLRLNPNGSVPHIFSTYSS